jgi:hypothetical protein
MIYLTFTVDNISTVLQVYDQILIERSDSESGTYTTVSGLGPIDLAAGQSSYTEVDVTGTATNWYRSRYYSTSTSSYSGYSSPILGDAGDLYYNPIYPPEVSYGTSQQLVIDRIRRLIGDPLSINREYGEDARSSLMADNMTFHMDDKGWPAAVTINNVQYVETSNPTVNGYRYLKFNQDISPTTTISGVTYGIDIWYYNFRHSDRQIMEAYDNCPPPAGLTVTTANSEHYMLQTAIDLLMQENWEYTAEDGAVIRDEGTLYDPAPGFRFREDMIDKLQKRLDDLVRTAILGGIEGVRLD